jgi:hypothetical protein
MIQADLGKKQDLISKTTRAKVWGLAQAVVYLPNKFEALSSNPSTTKGKKKSNTRAVSVQMASHF